MNVILANHEIAQFSLLNEKLGPVSGSLARSIQTFNYVAVNNGEVQKWVQGTEIGQLTVERIKKNIERLEYISAVYKDLVEQNQQIITNSKRVNN